DDRGDVGASEPCADERASQQGRKRQPMQQQGAAQHVTVGQRDEDAVTGLEIADGRDDERFGAALEPPHAEATAAGTAGRRREFDIELRAGRADDRAGSRHAIARSAGGHSPGSRHYSFVSESPIERNVAGGASPMTVTTLRPRRAEYTSVVPAAFEKLSSAPGRPPSRRRSTTAEIVARPSEITM